MRKLIFADVNHSSFTGLLGALEENGVICELYPIQTEDASLVGQIIVGQVDTVAEGIQAAFIRLQAGQNAYFPLKEERHLFLADGRGEESRLHRALKPGDCVLVQVQRDAMKGKLPTVTANLTLTGKYFVFTSDDTAIGYSAKLSTEEKNRLARWMNHQLLPDIDERHEQKRPFGVIVRTNAARAAEEELQEEFADLCLTFQRIISDGTRRTAGSVVYRPVSEAARLVRDLRTGTVDEIVTDNAAIYEELQNRGVELRFYQDRLLSLSRLYRLENALEEVFREKIWLKSGGFLVIQQTEAFVCIDVNTGKASGKKSKEETFLALNLEAAKEISRQLRLRNLSGTILIDFINLSLDASKEALINEMKKFAAADRIRCRVIDLTPLQILEMTRKKISPPIIEQLAAASFICT